MTSLTDITINGASLLWITIHLVGLSAAWLVRMRAGKRFEAMTQGGFFSALVAIAATTVVGHFYCLEIWPLSAVTMAVMVVVAVVEVGVSEASTQSFDS